VNGEGSFIDGPIAFDYISLFVDEDQIGNPDVSEMHTKRVDPEMVMQLRITRRNMTGHAFAETELGEQPKCRSQALLAMQPLFRHGLKDWHRWRFRNFDFWLGSSGCHGKASREQDALSFILDASVAIW
jgi:hypothetical protein